MEGTSGRLRQMGVLFLDWLPQGIYFINVQDQHEVLTKQIVISK